VPLLGLCVELRLFYHGDTETQRHRGAETQRRRDAEAAPRNLDNLNASVYFDASLENDLLKNL